MRKVTILTAMLTIFLVSAAPAFTQATGGITDLQYSDCRQVQASAAAQAGAASIAQELGIPQEQIDTCLETGGAIEDFVTGKGATANAGADGTDGALPATGGVSPITLGAGALLLASGLLLRRSFGN